MHPHIGQHLTVTQATATAGEDRYGVTMRPAGPLVPAAFGSVVVRRERQRIRAELSLAPQDLAVLLSSGSLGLGDVEATAAACVTPAGSRSCCADATAGCSGGSPLAATGRWVGAATSRP